MSSPRPATSRPVHCPATSPNLAAPDGAGVTGVVLICGWATPPPRSFGVYAADPRRYGPPAWMCPPSSIPFAKPTRASFVPIVRGEGALLWDADGHELVDGMASLWYCAAGHGRVEIADAVAAQLRTLAAYSCFDPFTTEPADRLAAELVEIGPMPDSRVFLCSSGSEAVDSVMKLARIAHVCAGQPQRKLIVSRDPRLPRRRLRRHQRPGPRRATGRTSGRSSSRSCRCPADDIEAVATLFAERGDEIAAVVTEPVQGAAGIYPPVDGYLAGLRKLCDQHGAYLVFDEVITGFGRLGSWFAAHHYGVRPDLVTFAKAVTSGYQPLGGVFVGAAPRAALESDPDFFLRHGFTYSGHAAACAAGLANLQILARRVARRPSDRTSGRASPTACRRSPPTG